VFLSEALTTRARVAIARGEPEQGERDAHDAPMRCRMASAAPKRRAASRSAVRFKVWDAGYEASVAAVRDASGENDFDSAWAHGAALSTEEAIAYAQRGRGQRKRPTSGWAALTPTERDVVRLVSEGLANNDIATRLFVSPRTVQTHLTHVYTKLGLSSRVQLVQEAARHT
jgi:DNA-binding CsgD family transcriptional regulator